MCASWTIARIGRLLANAHLENRDHVYLLTSVELLKANKPEILMMDAINRHSALVTLGTLPWPH